MSHRLFVSNLSASTTNLRLEQLFSRHGQVSGVRLVMDGSTGSSEGCGYVQMGSPDEASRAITALDGKVVDGQAIAVRVLTAEEEESFAAPAPAPKPRYGNGRGGRGVTWGRRS